MSEPTYFFYFWFIKQEAEPLDSAFSGRTVRNEEYIEFRDNIENIDN